MQPYEIFLSILEKPNVPRYYRDLLSFYRNSNMPEEAAAIDFLIENKFGKKNDEVIDDHTDNDQRQSGDN